MLQRFCLSIIVISAFCYNPTISNEQQISNNDANSKQEVAKETTDNSIYRYNEKVLNKIGQLRPDLHNTEQRTKFDIGSILLEYIFELHTICTILASANSVSLDVNFSERKYNVLIQALMQIDIKNKPLQSVLNFYKQIIFVNTLYGFLYNDPHYFIDSFNYNAEEASKFKNYSKKQLQLEVQNCFQEQTLNSDNLFWNYYTFEGLINRDTWTVDITTEQLKKMVSFVYKNNVKDYKTEENNTYKKIIFRIITDIYSFFMVLDYNLHVLDQEMAIQWLCDLENYD